MPKHLKRFPSLRAGSLLALLVTVGSLSLMPVGLGDETASANEFDTAQATLTFNELTQTRTAFRGTGTGTVETRLPPGTISEGVGRSLNDRVLYSSVVTINGTQIDALITTVSLGDRATIGKFDGGQAVASAPDLFQSEISYPADSTDKRVTFSFRFFVGGSYNGIQDAGTVALLKNVLVNSYDLDSTQFTDFTGFQSYLVSTNTTLRIDNSIDGRTRFIDDVAGGNSTWTATTGSYTKGRVQVKFNSLSSFTASIGATGSTGGWFAIDFGAGFAWSEGATLFTPIETLNSDGNRPPVSTNTTFNVTAGDTVAINRSAFGNYSDPDANPLTSIRIDSVPGTSTLERLVGNTWTVVTNGTVIPISDIDSGKLRYIHSGSTNDQLSFSVEDGLVFSSSPNTITFIPVSQSQLITFPNPGNKTLNQTIASSASASSGLQVTLSSSSPGVCTVSGTNIVLSGTGGTCTITASQTGSEVYASAPSVTQSFQVSAVVVNYTLTYDGSSPASGSPPADQVGSGSITIHGNTGNLTKSGFTFGGWLIGGVAFAPGASYNLSADATATAIWTPVFTSTNDGNPPDLGSPLANQPTPGIVVEDSNTQEIPELAQTGITSGESLIWVLLFLVLAGSGSLVIFRRLVQ